MAFNIFKSLFSNDANKTAISNNAEDLINTLSRIIVSGDYASSDEGNSQNKNQEAQENQTIRQK